MRHKNPNEKSVQKRWEVGKNQQPSYKVLNGAWSLVYQSPSNTTFTHNNKNTDIINELEKFIGKPT